MIFVTVGSAGTWDSAPYKSLNITWGLAVRLAKYLAKKHKRQVRLAQGNNYENPYYCNGHYFSY